MKELIVNDKYNEKKLITFLLDNFNGLNINTVYKALRKKDIRVNNVKINSNISLQAHDLSLIHI